jgi:dihydroneopterin aldolase
VDLALTGIECQAHIGVDEEERSARQRITVDLRLEADGAGAEEITRDPLERDVRRYLTEGCFVLVEAAILGLARLVFERTPARRVTIRLHKFVLPDTDFVAVEMAFRRREALAARGPRRGANRGRGR